MVCRPVNDILGLLYEEGELVNLNTTNIESTCIFMNDVSLSVRSVMCPCRKEALCMAGSTA